MLYIHLYVSGDGIPCDTNAHTLTSTYYDGALKMYAAHVMQKAAPDGKTILLYDTTQFLVLER